MARVVRIVPTVSFYTEFHLIDPKFYIPTNVSKLFGKHQSCPANPSTVSSLLKRPLQCSCLLLEAKPRLREKSFPLLTLSLNELTIAIRQLTLECNFEKQSPFFLEFRLISKSSQPRISSHLAVKPSGPVKLHNHSRTGQ